MQQLADAFGTAPRSLANDDMAFRVERPSFKQIFSHIPQALREPMLTSACHVRAGVVVAVQKVGG
jgi:hypothetical protein